MIAPILAVIMLFGMSEQWVLAASQGSAAVSENVEIDRIDISGVKVFQGAVLEGMLEISPGDRLERLKVVRTEENLQNLYRTHGYQEVSIRSRLIRKKGPHGELETVLEFQVTEGDPTRISSLEVVPMGGQLDPVASKAFQKKQKKLRKNIPLNNGDILDQEKIAEGRRAVQELLASEEFIGAKVNAVLITPVSAPLPESAAKGAGAARWVTVSFQIDMGEKVTFGFRGNTVFTSGYLSGLILEQRLLGLGKDYVNALKMRLEEEYRSIGYAKVEITPYLFEEPGNKERKVTYIIQEGPRIKIRAVEFDGNSVFSSDELRDQFFEKGTSLLQHSFYVEKDVQKTAELLVETLKEKGYLSARLITINRTDGPRTRNDPTTGSVNLLIYLYEGEQTFVHSITIEGATAFSADELTHILRIQPQTPLNLYVFAEGIEAVKRAYREKGYLDVKIVNEGAPDLITYSQENRFADVSLKIEEGPQFKVSRVELEGLEYTKEDIVRRELRFTEGQVLAQSQLEESERALRRLGIFGTISSRAYDDPNQPGNKAIRVSLKEADRGILSWGPGFRNDLGLRAFGQLAYTNLWGLNHSVSMTVSANRRFYQYNFGEAQAQLAYAWPGFLMRGMTFRPVISAGRIQYINFSSDSVAVLTAWDKQLLIHPNLVGQFGYTFESINQFAAQNVDYNGQMTIGTITPQLTLDLRDNPLAPTSGFYTKAWMDLAYPFLGSQTQSTTSGQQFPVGYYRFQFRGDLYVPLLKDVVWYFSFRTGIEQSVVNTRDLNNPNPDPKQDAIPLNKQFAMGGVGSLRGYREQELNYQLNSIRGSLAYVNYRTQLNLPFAGALKFALFLDAANLTIDNYSLGNLLFGTGFGFHYDTPVGPISVDWGFKLAPQPGQDPYVVHFSVGII